MGDATSATGDHYAIISADCHAGGSPEMYREHLERKYRDDFDAWHGARQRSFHLQNGDEIRNWDDDRRFGDQETDGVVAEVVFPNTPPPFFPSFVLFARPPKPDEYEHRLAGVRAHHRWLAEFCGRHPERRAGVGLILLNNVDDAIEDVRWIKEHGLRGGILISAIPPDVKYIKPLYEVAYDPLWRVCEELEVPVNTHHGGGLPDYGRHPAAAALLIDEVPFYSQRAFVQLMVSGVFERFPKLKFAMTELGCAWLPSMLRRLDNTLEQVRTSGRTGRFAHGSAHRSPRSATESFRRCCHVGVSQPGPDDVAARFEVGVDRFMWGSDYPHDEGTYPYTRQHLRQLLHNSPPDELAAIVAGNAARLYGFDLAKLAPLAEKVGPTVAELATPLDRLPDHPNEALLKATRGP